MATMKDVAERAKVSTASVSKVLNGDYSGVSIETKERILQAAADLKYRPNRIARGLARNKTNIIGLVVPDVGNPYYAELAKGIGDQAEGSGYNVILCGTNGDIKKERKHIDMLIGYNVDGVVLVGMDGCDPKSGENLLGSSIPYVTIDREDTKAPVIFLSNSMQGSLVASEFLIQKGHRNLAFISGEAKDHGKNSRLHGYRVALELHQIPVVEERICYGAYTMESGYDCTNQLLDRSVEFTAIVCSNDLIAFGAMKALRERGLSVPEDVSLVGYDDIVLSSFFEPKLTTIRQDSYQLGRSAFGELHKRIQGEKEEHVLRSVEPELVIRDSVKTITS